MVLWGSVGWWWEDARWEVGWEVHTEGLEAGVADVVAPEM